MRITPSMMMGKYQNLLEDNLSRLNSESDRISSERKFTRASDDPVAAMKVLRTNRQMASLEQYQQSGSETGSWVDATESALNTVGQIIKSADATILEANSGTNSTDDLQTHAKSLESYQQELLETLNGTFNGQYVFGGSSSGAAPFKIGTAEDINGSTADVDPSGNFQSDQVVGKLLYKLPQKDGSGNDVYIPVSAVNNLTDTTDPLYKYSMNNQALTVSMPVDLGLGIKTDSSGAVVSGTAIEAATSPFDFLCFDADSSSSTNIVDVLGSTADTLEKATAQVDLSSVIGQVDSAQNAELKSVVKVGEKSKMLDFLGDKMTQDNTNLTERLSSIEDVDITKESTAYYMDQMVYNASLSISSNVLQHSLIDFLK